MVDQPGVFKHVYGPVQHVIIKVGSQSRSEIVSELSTDIAEDELVIAREELFKVAKEIFQQRTSVSVDIDLKTRKGKNAAISIAGDIHDLYSFASIEDSIFPKDVIKQGSKLLDYESAKDHNTEIATSDQPKTSDDVTNPHDYVIMKNEIVDLRSQVTSLKADLNQEKTQKDLLQIQWNEKFNILLSQLVVCGVFHEKNIDDMFNVCPKHNINRNHQESPVVSQHTTGSSVVTQHVSMQEISRNAPQEQAAGATSQQTREACPPVGQGDRPTAPNLPLNTGVREVQARATPGKSTQPEGAPRRPVTAVENADTSHDRQYSAVVSEGPWVDVTRRRKSEEKPSLRGVRKEQPIYVYLRDVYVHANETENELKTKVREHASLKDVRIMNIHIKYNRYTDDTVGCKLAIPSNCLNKVLENDFWPEDISCRRWVDHSGRTRERHAPDTGNSRSDRNNDNHVRNVNSRYIEDGYARFN